MEYDFEDAVALLARTPATLDAFLRHLPESWTRSNEGAKTWSVFDILGHLIHGERTDWMPRARMILQFAESKAFEPFDRLACRDAADIDVQSIRTADRGDRGHRRLLCRKLRPRPKLRSC